jgi:hypothetical protein
MKPDQIITVLGMFISKLHVNVSPYTNVRMRADIDEATRDHMIGVINIDVMFAIQDNLSLND